MSNLLGQREALELLDRLRTTVRAFGAREAELEHEYRTQSAAESRRSETASAREDEQLADALATADQSYQAERERRRSRFEQRQTRIARAHRTTRRQAIKSVEHEEGRLRYTIQKHLLEAERRRDTELAAAATAWTDMQQKVADSRAVFETLEAGAQRAFRGYRGLGRGRSRTPDPAAGGSPSEEEQALGELDDLRQQVGTGLDRFRRFILPRVFGRLSIWLWILALLLAHAWLVVVAPHFGIRPFSLQQVGLSGFTLLALLLAVYWVGGRRAQPAATAIAHDLAKARRLHEVCLQPRGSSLEVLLRTPLPPRNASAAFQAT